MNMLCAHESTSFLHFHAVTCTISHKECLLDHLSEFITRIGPIGSGIEIGEHDDRGAHLGLVAHPALEARNLTVVSEKAAIVYHSQPVPVWLPQPRSEVHKAQPLLLGRRAEELAGGQGFGPDLEIVQRRDRR